MKKILAIVLTLALALSLSVSAFAEGDHTVDQSDQLPATKDTTVQFSVDPTYTITIPATVELGKETDADTSAVTYEQDATITASKNVRLLNKQSIRVTLSAGEDGFVLTSKESATLDYTVTVGNTEIQSGDTVATFVTNTAEQTSILHFAANDPTYAGEYSDTVTFTISIVSAQDADTDNTEPTEP